MNTQTINTELVLALRKCLPFVREHTTCSGGGGTATYAFAVRVLADADARQQQERAVKSIAEAEKQRMRTTEAILGYHKAFGIKATRALLDYIGTPNVHSATPRQQERIQFLCRCGPSRVAQLVENKKVIEAGKPSAQLYPSDNALRVARDHGYAGKMLLAFAKRRSNAAISGGEAVKQAARPNYTPATPPAKGCSCEVCVRARMLSGSIYRDFYRGNEA